MEATADISTQTETVKTNFWRKLFNLKIVINTMLVWLGLMCQDIYAMFGWISTSFTPPPELILRGFKILILLYAALLFLSWFVNRPKLKTLYHKKVTYIILAIWLVMNLSCYQLLYFDYLAGKSVYLLKALHLLALYALVLTITRLIQRWREPKIKRQLIFTAIFCVVGWIFLLLTFPGGWNSSDIRILNRSAYYDLSPWRHMFSGIFYILCLQTIPLAFSVIFFQILLNALLFGYCVVTLGNLFSKTPRQALILTMILSFAFILPPVLFYTLTGYRIGIYQFLELYLLTRLIDFFYHKEQKISWLNLLEILFFTVVVSTWRSEGIFYSFVVLVVLLLLGKNRLKRSLAFATACLALISTFAISTYNRKLIGHDGYTVVSTFVPVCAIIREADNLDETTLSTLDKVVNVEFIQTNSAKDYSWYYSNGGYRREHTQAEYHAYLNTVVRIVFQHPDIAMKAWSTNFQNTVNLDADKKSIYSHLIGSIDSFTTPTSKYYWFDRETYPYISDSYFHAPINPTVRNQVLAWLLCFELDNNSSKHLSYERTPMHEFFYGLKIPAILFLAAIIITLFCRRWFLLLPCAAILCHFVIVFFTAPTTVHFYYQPVSFLMCVFSVAMIWYGACSLIGKIRKENDIVTTPTL